MKGRKPEILFSEPVNEVLGNPPGKILRFGSAIIFIVFIFFIVFAWLIEYPDLVSSQIEITTINPPVSLIAKTSGRIKKLAITDREKVFAGKLIAVLETTASVEEVNKLGILLDSVVKPEKINAGSIPYLSKLGELQPYYSVFKKNLEDLQNFVSNDYYGNKMNSLSQEIDALREYIKKIGTKEKLYIENQILDKSRYMRDSILYIQKVIPQSEFENSHQIYIRNNIELQEVRLENSAKLIELVQKGQMLHDYELTANTERDRFITSLRESFNNLKAQYTIWRDTFLLIAPVEGTTTFTKFWSENQSVVKDETVFSIVPENSGEIIGRIDLKMQRSGKVKTGQSVNIKLSGYPYLEYGIIRGIIKSKSLVPAGDHYVIEVELPNGLVTKYGKKLEFTQKMQGTAEIITEKISLLEKIINPIRYLNTKNK
jgi:multidrug resistance efflux pump